MDTLQSELNELKTFIAGIADAKMARVWMS